MLLVTTRTLGLGTKSLFSFRLFLRHLLTPETLSFINIVNSSSIAAPKLDMDFGRIDTDFYLQIVNGKKISIRTENLKESEIDAIFNRYIKKLLEDTS